MFKIMVSFQTFKPAITDVSKTYKYDLEIQRKTDHVLTSEILIRVKFVSECSCMKKG